MVDEIGAGAGNPAEDVSASNEATDGDDKQAHVGLTTKSLVKAAEKVSLTPEQKQQENINKRIGKLVGQKHGLEEENAGLRERVAVLESKSSDKSGSDEKTYSNSQLETAYAKAKADDNDGLMFEIMTQMSKNNTKAELAEYKKGTDSKTQAADRRQGELNVLGQDFPALRDQGSLLTMTVNKIIEARPDLKSQDVQGYYRAAALAQQIIHEEGGDVSASTANKANKKGMKESLGTGDTSGDEIEASAKSDEQANDDYIKERQKSKDDFFKEVDDAATGKSMRGK